MTGGVASTVIRRHAPASQSRRRGSRRGLMMVLFVLGALAGTDRGAGSERAYMIRGAGDNHARHSGTPAKPAGPESITTNGEVLDAIRERGQCAGIFSIFYLLSEKLADQTAIFFARS
jgi:hypothetical protein